MRVNPDRGMVNDTANQSTADQPEIRPVKPAAQKN
jgi:hypothetical protein